MWNFISIHFPCNLVGNSSYKIVWFFREEWIAKVTKKLLYTNFFSRWWCSSETTTTNVYNSRDFSLNFFLFLLSLSSCFQPHNSTRVAAYPFFLPTMSHKIRCGECWGNLRNLRHFEFNSSWVCSSNFQALEEEFIHLKDEWNENHKE